MAASSGFDELVLDRDGDVVDGPEREDSSGLDLLDRLGLEMAP